MNEILEEAQAAIEADKQHRATECMAAINAACEQYRCTIVGSPQITSDGRITTIVQIVAQ